MKKRILFVDDETNILQGLKRMLHGQRKEWDMTFAEGAEEALAIMERETFDAVVSDMRMPGMDGAQFLKIIMERYPDTVRLILSGYADQDVVMSSIGPSHQYLSKPCDTETLQSVLSNAFDIHSLLGKKSLRELVTGINNLPSLPDVYNEIMERIQLPETSIGDVAAIVVRDPGMCMKILKLVNSAYFGMSRKITSPQDAVMYLGLDTLKALTLSFGVFTQFSQSRLDEFDLDAVWDHSLAVGSIARRIAGTEHASKDVCEAAFMAGLLHDVGKLILAANLPKEYARVWKLVKQEQMDPLTAEESVFETTHAEVGAYLLGLWGIPNAVVMAVGYHHRPGDYLTDSRFTPLTALHVANATLNESGRGATGFSGRGVCIDMEYLESHGVAGRLPEWLALCKLSDEDAA